MNNSLHIINGFPKQFWAEVMDTAKYLQNRLPTRYIADKVIIIPEEAWIETKQNHKYIRIFSNIISTHPYQEMLQIRYTQDLE